MDTNQMTAKQLRELAKLREQEEIAAGKPKKLAAPDFAELEKRCDSIIAEALKKEDDREVDLDDVREYIYEAAMTAFYGPGVFDWLNKTLYA